MFVLIFLPSKSLCVNHIYRKLRGIPVNNISQTEAFLTISDNSEAKFLAQYLAELTLLEAETYLHFAPSVIGAASVALSRHTLGLAAWDLAMSEKTGYQISDFQVLISPDSCYGVETYKARSFHTFDFKV